MTEELRNLIKTYQSSKILRLGVTYLETETRFRHVLAEEVGISVKVLRDYSKRVVFWPHTREVTEESLRAKWSDAEDNLIMAHYQVTRPDRMQKMLPRRAWHSIQKRASILGVNKYDV